MPKSSKYSLGTRSGEIISVPIEIISVRLKDGSILGPKLYTGTDDKKHMEEGSRGLNYNEEELEIILERGWNRRRGSLLHNIDSLKAAIQSAGRVLDPLDLISDGPYVVCAEGHRRHICSRWLQLEGFPISVVPAMVYIAGYGSQGNYENFEYQMWYRNQKEPLSLIEKYEFIQEKIASGLTKEEFCEKVGISIIEYDTIMLVAGQSREVRNLIEEGLISPTTIKIAKLAAERKEWTQQQFEEFIQESVKLAESLGRKRVTGNLVQALITEYKLPEQVSLIDSIDSQVKTQEEEFNQEEKTITVNSNNSTVNKSTKPAKIKVKPTAKELEQMFIELMFDSQGGNEEETLYNVSFSKEVWEKALLYFDRIPDKLIEKVNSKFLNH